MRGDAAEENYTLSKPSARVDMRLFGEDITSDSELNNVLHAALEGLVDFACLSYTFVNAHCMYLYLLGIPTTISTLLRDACM